MGSSEDDNDDSEARENLAEMAEEGVFDPQSSDSDDSSQEEGSSSDDYYDEEEESGEAEEDSFEEKYGEPRIEELETIPNTTKFDEKPKKSEEKPQEKQQKKKGKNDTKNKKKGK